MWPDMRFDPMKLFDLHTSDLLCFDPFTLRQLLPVLEKLGDDLFIGLSNSSDVVGYLCETCPDRSEWLREGVIRFNEAEPERVRDSEAKLLQDCWPWNLGMAKSPEIWDALPWSGWDPSVIYERVDVEDKDVLDIGAGTGQVTIRCAPYAEKIWALEPVGRLRRYIERKSWAAGFRNVRTLDGVLESVPLEDSSVDAAILSNGSFGWNPDKELLELNRVVRPRGTVLMLGPCNFTHETVISAILAAGYEQFEWEAPGDGIKPAFVKQR